MGTSYFVMLTYCNGNKHDDAKCIVCFTPITLAYHNIFLLARIECGPWKPLDEEQYVVRLRTPSGGEGIGRTEVRDCFHAA